jgi:hypothetical protein
MSPVLVRELRKGSWYVVVRYKGRKYVRKVAESKKKADDIKRDLEKLINENGYAALDKFKPKGSVHGWTVNKYADKWLGEIKKSGLKPSTIDSYESNIRLHIKPHFGDLPLIDVSYGRVKEFVADRMEAPYEYGSKKKDKRPKRAYSRDSIRIMVATLRSMLEEAVRDELLENNPCHGLGRLFGSQKTQRKTRPIFARRPPCARIYSRGMDALNHGPIQNRDEDRRSDRASMG